LDFQVSLILSSQFGLYSCVKFYFSLGLEIPVLGPALVKSTQQNYFVFS